MHIPTPRTLHRPSVGLLFNATTPAVMEEGPDLVEHLAVDPGLMLHDLGSRSPSNRRFAFPACPLQWMAELREGRRLNAHSFGLSLPAPSPLDEELVTAITHLGERLGGFDWLTEHLHGLLPRRDDLEKLERLSDKLLQLRRRTGLRLLLENPARTAPPSAMAMGEPAFLNYLYRQGYCGVLLDLPNLLVSARHGGMAVERYLGELNPEAVEAVHLAGGGELPPEIIWSIGRTYLPCCPNLRAITIDVSATRFDRIGGRGVRQELERVHQLAATCALAHRPDP
jgi:hypothetical protein